MRLQFLDSMQEVVSSVTKGSTKSPDGGPPNGDDDDDEEEYEDDEEGYEEGEEEEEENGDYEDDYEVEIGQGEVDPYDDQLAGRWNPATPPVTMGWLAPAPTTAVAFTQKEEKKPLKKRATSATPAPKGRTIDKDGVIHDAKREGSGKRSASGGPTSAGASNGKKVAAPKSDDTGRGRSPHCPEGSCSRRRR